MQLHKYDTLIMADNENMVRLMTQGICLYSYAINGQCMSSQQCQFKHHYKTELFAPVKVH